MTSFVFFIERIAFGLYLLSVAGLLWMAHRLRQARRDLAVAQFQLEREHALARQASAITWGGLLVEFVVAVWAISNVMAPTLQDMRLGENAYPERVLERFVTSTPVSNPPIGLGVEAQGEEGPIIFATPIPTATPVGTIMPDVPEIVGCPKDSAWLHIPANGQLLFEATTVVGTANIPNFAFYRFEIKPAQPGAEFAPIGGDYTVPVINGPLGEILPFNFPTGEYRFRLSVFDQTTTLRALCEVTIFFSEPPPTPTPIGAPTAVPTPAP